MKNPRILKALNAKDRPCGLCRQARRSNWKYTLICGFYGTPVYYRDTCSLWLPRQSTQEALFPSNEENPQPSLTNAVSAKETA